VLSTIPAFKFDPETGQTYYGALMVGSCLATIVAVPTSIAAAWRNPDRRTWWGVLACVMPILIVFGMLIFSDGFHDDCGCDGMQ